VGADDVRVRSVGRMAQAQVGNDETVWGFGSTLSAGEVRH